MISKFFSPKIWFAYWMLACYLVRNILRRTVFFWHFFEDGVEKMRQAFGNEGVDRVGPEDRLKEIHFSRCIGCQLCSLAHPLLPMMATTFVRAPDRAREVRPLIEFLSVDVCQRGERICPTQVPLVAMREVLIN